MTDHTALLTLPDRLRAAGLNVIVADGYASAQGNYLWTLPSGNQSYDNPPSGYMVHHSAGSTATPPPADDSKGNAWIGLYRDGKLYTTGGGVPTIYLACSGPARISSGYGFKPAAWDYTFQDRRAPAGAQGSDGETALNRYVFNMETVHPGDGSALDQGVWEHVVGLGAVLADMFGWTERTLGHRSWSQRKIDPKWAVGKPHDGIDCIIDVQDGIAAWSGGTQPPTEPPVEPPDQGELVDIGRNQEYVKEGQTGQDVEYWQVRIIEVIKGIQFYGNSAKTFITAEAPELTYKVWDAAMTAYFSAWTGRNSYGVGSTERIMVDAAWTELYN